MGRHMANAKGRASEVVKPSNEGTSDEANMSKRNPLAVEFVPRMGQDEAKLPSISSPSEMQTHPKWSK